MKQQDVINSVVNQMLKVEEKDIEGQIVKVSYSTDSVHLERNILALIEREYRLRGKPFNFDPTRMIEKIAKLVKK